MCEATAGAFTPPSASQKPAVYADLASSGLIPALSSVFVNSSTSLPS